MRVLVCGGRDYNDRDRVNQVLDALCDEFDLWEPREGNRLPRGLMIIHGGARGADEWADIWAVSNWVPMTRVPAEWKKYGKMAGSIRNQKMIDDCKPDLVVAFPGGKGTLDMVIRAKRAGIEVRRIADG